MLYVTPVSNGLGSSEQFNIGGAQAGISALGTGDDPRKEKQALVELEHYFSYVLLREMRKTVPENTLLGGGRQQETFEEMLDDALAGEIADSGQLGLADSMKESLEIARDQARLRTECQAQAGEEPVPISFCRFMELNDANKTKGIALLDVTSSGRTRLE